MVIIGKLDALIHPTGQPASASRWLSVNRAGLIFPNFYVWGQTSSERTIVKHLICSFYYCQSEPQLMLCALNPPFKLGLCLNNWSRVGPS